MTSLQGRPTVVGPKFVGTCAERCCCTPLPRYGTPCKSSGPAPLATSVKRNDSTYSLTCLRGYLPSTHHGDGTCLGSCNGQDVGTWSGSFAPLKVLTITDLRDGSFGLVVRASFSGLHSPLPACDPPHPLIVWLARHGLRVNCTKLACLAFICVPMYLWVYRW